MDFNELIKENHKKVLIILVLFLLIGILLSFKLIMIIINKNTSCLNNPFVYNAQRLYDEGMEVICTCYPLDEKFNIFEFNRYNLTVRKDLASPYRESNINFSDLEID